VSKILLKIGGVALLLFLFFYGQFFIAPKNILAGIFKRVVDFPVALVSSVVHYDNYPERIRTLELENENLKAQVAAFSQLSGPKIIDGHSVFRANVFSSYPFNTQGRLMIDAGSRAGLKVGLPVTVGGALLLGQIVSVNDDMSEVRTVFDPGWELPVKVGSAGVDALFVGGRTPKLTLITKDKEVNSGDDAYSVGQAFPYHLKIGEVGSIENNKASAFQDASIAISYSVNNVSEVVVLLP